MHRLDRCMIVFGEATEHVTRWGSLSVIHLTLQHILQGHVVQRARSFDTKPAVDTSQMVDMAARQPPHTVTCNHWLLADNARLLLLLLQLLHWHELEHCLKCHAIPAIACALMVFWKSWWPRWPSRGRGSCTSLPCTSLPALNRYWPSLGRLPAPWWYRKWPDPLRTPIGNPLWIPAS